LFLIVTKAARTFWDRPGTIVDDSVAAFRGTASATWNELNLDGIDAKVGFSPRSKGHAVLADIADDVARAQSSLLFSLAFLYQTPGPVLKAIKKLKGEAEASAGQASPQEERASLVGRALFAGTQDPRPRIVHIALPSVGDVWLGRQAAPVLPPIRSHTYIDVVVEPKTLKGVAPPWQHGRCNPYRRRDKRGRCHAHFREQVPERGIA
jgi:hypothetical protein